MSLSSRSQYESSLTAAAEKQTLEVYVLIGLVIAFCALAVVNAVWMSTAERAREFALLRLVGAGKAQVRTMVRAETLIMLAFGLTIGTIIAIPGLAAVSRDLTGSAVPTVSLRLYAVLAAAFTVLTFAAGVIPTRLALRMDPVKAMSAGVTQENDAFRAAMSLAEARMSPSKHSARQSRARDGRASAM